MRLNRHGRRPQTLKFGLLARARFPLLGVMPFRPELPAAATKLATEHEDAVFKSAPCTARTCADFAVVPSFATS